jgi:cyclopropane fatty-acyl-phospholipid synthase-like methyltransferase
LCWQGKRYHNNQKSPNQQKNHNMIRQILSSVTGLTTSCLDSKAQQKLLETEIRKKQLTGEIDWELEATRSAQNSWKDELCAIDYAEVLVV